MKKRNLRERKAEFKKAYYTELQKIGLMEEPKTKEVEKMTKAELMKLAKERMIEVNSKITKTELIKLLEENKSMEE